MIFFENITTSVSNLWSDTKTTEDSTNSVLQGIFALSADTLNDAFFHLGGNISELSNLKNFAVTADITQR